MRLPHHVDHRQVLDVGALADAYVIDVAANHHVHPHRGFSADVHITNHLCALIDVRGAVDGRRGVLEAAKHDFRGPQDLKASRPQDLQIFGSVTPRWAWYLPFLSL